MWLIAKLGMFWHGFMEFAKMSCLLGRIQTLRIRKIVIVQYFSNIEQTGCPTS
jgi:hypothetical protein